MSTKEISISQFHKRQADGNFYCSKHNIALKKRPIKGRYFCEECPEGEGEFCTSNDFLKDTLELSVPRYSLAKAKNVNDGGEKTHPYRIAPLERFLRRKLGASLD